MSRESTRRQFLAAGGAAGAVALAGCGGGGGGGGGNGTIDWYYADSNKQLSMELVSLINTRDSQDFKLRKGGGPADAVKRLNNETGEFAVVGADVASFAKKGAGMGAISTKYKDIRAIMSLYPMPVTLVARPGLEADTLDELSGASVNVGPRDSRLTANAQQVLNNIETDLSVTNMPLSDALSKVTAGELDVTFAIGDWPIPAVQEATPDINILGLSDTLRGRVVESTDWFVDTQLPAGVYEGIDYMTPTLGIMALLLTRDRFDQKRVSIVTDRILTSVNNGDIKTRSSYIPGKDDARVGIPRTVPLHDGSKQVIVYGD